MLLSYSSVLIVKRLGASGGKCPPQVPFPPLIGSTSDPYALLKGSNKSYSYALADGCEECMRVKIASLLSGRTGTH
jgi:hypothetical protein